MADHTCRDLERVRRVAVVDHAAGRRPDFEPARSWDIVFQEVTKAHACWADNLGRSALQLATKIATASKLADDGFGRVTLALEDTVCATTPKPKKSS